MMLPQVTLDSGKSVMQAILSATGRTRCGEPASGYAQTGLGLSDFTLGERIE
jgi:hypothetical protein